MVFGNAIGVGTLELIWSGSGLEERRSVGQVLAMDMRRHACGESELCTRTLRGDLQIRQNFSLASLHDIAKRILVLRVFLLCTK